MAESSANPLPLTCKSCGGLFPAPRGQRQAGAALIEEESARCRRLREIGLQRQTLAARLQAGPAGTLGGDAIDTNDLLAQRQSIAQLDATLAAEAAALSQGMLHVPRAMD